MEKVIYVTKPQLKEVAEKYAYKLEGANIPTKVIDLDAYAHDMVEDRKKNNEAMIIEVSPIIKRKQRDTNLGVTCVKDPFNNVLYGIFTGLDDYKNPLWARINMDNGITLNLENINDAKRWIIVRLHPRVQGSPFENDPIFEVNDPTIESKKIYQRVQKTEKLFDIIGKMNGAEIVDSLRYLGEPVTEQLTYKVAKSMLFKLVLDSTDLVYQKLTNKQKNLEAKIIAAVEYGIIENRSENGYIFNEMPLGISINDVMNYFESNKTVRDSILSEVGQKDVVSHNVQAEFQNIKKNDKEEAIF